MLKLNKKKVKEIETNLKKRFNQLDNLRAEFDEDIKEEIELYNDKDKYINKKDDYQEQITVPYLYTIVQTMVARLYETLFGEDNFIKVFIEKKKFRTIEKILRNWIQGVLDAMRFKSRSRDFLEDSLVQRTVWLHPIPLIEKGGFKGIDFDVITWFDIWYDHTVRKVCDTDFFVRKIKKLYKLKDNKEHYFNIEEITHTMFPEDDTKSQEIYSAKHGVSKYYDINNDLTANVELLEWWGIYNIGTDENPDYQEVIFTLANRNILIRAEKNTMKTVRKRLFFPIRALRQANSLVSKSVPQLTKKQQYELNEIRSLRMQNFKTQIKLLFKMKKESGVDMDDLFAKGGNVIGYEDLPTDIDTFTVPNMVQLASAMGGETIQDMQQVTGAVDYLMGTTAGRGITETARGISTITEQALFKFGMMANNIHDDILDFINFVIILYIKHDKKNILVEYPELGDFFEQTEEEIEKGFAIDIALKDLAARREIERSQFINAINIIAGLMAQTGGNMKELLKQTMERLGMENIDAILEAPQAQAGMEGLAGQMAQQGGGSTKISPQADKASTPDEEASNLNVPQ